MLHVFPLIVWSAISQALFSGSFVPIMNSCMAVHLDWNDNKKLSMSLFAMIPLGIGEVIGGFILGFILDRWKQKAGITYCIFTTIVAYVIVFLQLAFWEFNVLTFFMTFFWGIQDSTLTNFINCILGFEFESKIIPFSVFKFS